METAQRTSPSAMRAAMEAALSQLRAREEKLVFKSMRRDLGDRRDGGVAREEVADGDDATGQEIVLAIVGRIQRAVRDLAPGDASGEALPVEREDIRTLAQAEQETSYVAKLVHSIEHKIWL
jgi:hypothetical protein